jgi:nucleotide-binding universal stress UspA family protein
MMIGAEAAKIVVGFDGSPAARDAVEWAAAAARRLDAVLRVVLAWESMDPWLPPSTRSKVEQELEVRAEAVLDGAVAELCDQVTVEAVLRQGPAAGTLVDEAEGALLLVVGAHGQGGIMPGLGSMAARCVVWSKVPTVVVPAGTAPEPSPESPVVVGVDASAGGERALRVALALAPPAAPVRVVHAWGIPPTAAFEVPAVEPALLEEGGRAVLDQACAAVPPGRPGAVETALERGDPREVLSREAESASLLVIGSRGHSLLLHRLLGSTVTYLLHEQVTPVVVVPEEAADWQEGAVSGGAAG